MSDKVELEIDPESFISVRSNGPYKIWVYFGTIEYKSFIKSGGGKEQAHKYAERLRKELLKFKKE